MPVLTLVLLGVVDLGRAFHQSIALHEAVQAGGLVALDWQRVTELCPAPCATLGVLTVIASSPAGITIVDQDVTLGPDGAPGVPGPAWIGADAWRPSQPFTVMVSHPFTFISPYLNIGTNRTLTLTSTISAIRNP